MLQHRPAADRRRLRLHDAGLRSHRLTLSERRLTIGAAPRLLEARLAEPPSPPIGAAVVCHPHPEYGGNMHNPVVLAAVRGCLEAGWAALRLNFAGRGESGGSYSGGAEGRRDVVAAGAAVGG